MLAVLARIIGKGGVDSSILSGGTSFSHLRRSSVCKIVQIYAERGENVRNLTVQNPCNLFHWRSCA